MAKIWRIKPHAPPHYVHGVGLLGPGDEFTGGDTAMSMHVEEVVQAKPAAPEPAKRGRKAGAPDPAPVEVEQGPSGTADVPAEEGF